MLLVDTITTISNNDTNVAVAAKNIWFKKKTQKRESLNLKSMTVKSCDNGTNNSHFSFPDIGNLCQ